MRKRITPPLNLRWRRTMQLMCLWLFIGVTSLSAKPDRMLNIPNHRGTLNEFFKEIEKQSDYRFFYNDELVNIEKEMYQLDIKNKSIDEVLTVLLANTGLKYRKLDNNLIVISSKELLQSATITGTVVDATGSPITGVNVALKGTAIGTNSDINGNFSLNIPDGNATLVFSFIGYTSQEVKVGTQRSLRITLLEDDVQLSEVVVIAYGTAKKKDLTGSVSTVESKTIGVQSNSTVTRALEGAVAGLQVSAVDGQPGLDMGIRVRGLGSGSQNNSNSLIVIDGVPAQNDNPLATLNSQDIETITILKDAASTALYGSRGANGVVLITTKKGIAGKTKISFEGRWGINQAGPYQYDKIENPKDVYEYTWQTIYNAYRYGVNGSGTAIGYTTNVKNPNHSHEESALFASQHLFDYNNSETAFQRNRLGNWMLYNVPGAVYNKTGAGANSSATMSGSYLVNPDGKLNPNAQLLYYDRYDDYVLLNKLRQQYNVTASGGGGKTDYFVSLGYLEDPSYVIGSKFGRYSGRSNINSQLYDWLKVGANVSYAYRTTQSPATRYGRSPGSAVANVFRWINGQNPLVQYYAHDLQGNSIDDANGNKKVHMVAGNTASPLGETTGPLSAGVDLVRMLEMDQDTRRSSDLNTRSYAQFSFLKDFTFTVNLALDKYHETRTRYWNSETGQVNGVGAFGKVYQNVTNLNLQQLLNYNRDWDKHHVDALAGHEFNRWDLEQLYYNSAYELIPGFVSFANFVGRYTGGTFNSPGGGEASTAMESYIGRANYIYDNKYYLSASLRRDGSSKFKYASNRWGTFWSVGGGWRASDEFFLKDISWLDNLKLRGSYGVLGNQNGIGNYSGYQTWNYGATYTSTTSGTGTPASYTLSQGGYVNDGLTWENSHSLDIGVDFSLFNRVWGAFDFYNRDNVNAVWSQPIAFSLGQGSLEKNTAHVRSRGIEVELGVNLIKNKDFSWSIMLNGTHYTSVLKKVPDGIGIADGPLKGCWLSGVDGWSANGAPGVSDGTPVLLRGIDKPYYNIYIYKYEGVDQSTGLPLFYHEVTEADHTNGLYTDIPVGGGAKTTNYSTASRKEFGSAIPAWIGGFNTTLTYKNFDFTAILAYQLGGKFYSTEYGNGLYRNNQVAAALSGELLGNTWTPDNTGAKFPMAMYGNNYGDGSTIGSWMYTDMALFDASYCNLKNITLGYTLPKSLLAKANISALRVYASADNLFMFTSHSGIDPRMSLVGGFEVGAYAWPSMRTVSVGINLDF